MHPDDIFEHMFGFGGGFSFYMGGGGGGGRAPPRQSRDTEIEYDLTLEEAFVGKNVTLAMERDRTCGQCQGCVMHVISVCGGICSTCVFRLFLGLERRMALSSEIAESAQERDSSWRRRWCVPRSIIRWSRLICGP